MEINLTDLKINFKATEDNEKSNNILGHVYLSLTGDEKVRISGIILWKSKYGGYNITYPKNRDFIYAYLSDELKNKVEKEIINAYESYIPVIN